MSGLLTKYTIKVVSALMFHDILMVLSKHGYKCRHKSAIKVKKGHGVKISLLGQYRDHNSWTIK